MKQIHPINPFTLLAGIGLVGCAAIHPAATGLLPTTQGATVLLQPQVLAGRHVQAVVPLNDSTAIASLSVIPYVDVSLSGDPVYRPLQASDGQATDSADPAAWYAITQASPSIDLTKAVALTNLSPNKKYRIVARAYNAAGAQISSDASSSVDVAVTNNDRPTMGTLPIKLNDRYFAAQTTITLVRNGDSSYDHVYLSFFSVASGIETAVPNATASVLPDFNGKNVSVGKLQANTRYRLKAALQDADDTDLSTASVDIVVTNDDAPATASLTINVPVDG